MVIEVVPLGVAVYVLLAPVEEHGPADLPGQEKMRGRGAEEEERRRRRRREGGGEEEERRWRKRGEDLTPS